MRRIDSGAVAMTLAFAVLAEKSRHKSHAHAVSRRRFSKLTNFDKTEVVLVGL